MLELYLMEGCPYCAKVRRAMERLGLDYIARPATPRTEAYEELIRLGGKGQVPFLVHPEAGVSMYESDEIIAYLEKTFG